MQDKIKLKLQSYEQMLVRMRNKTMNPKERNKKSSEEEPPTHNDVKMVFQKHIYRKNK